MRRCEAIDRTSGEFCYSRDGGLNKNNNNNNNSTYSIMKEQKRKKEPNH